jgi:hypothetical protein
MLKCGAEIGGIMKAARGLLLVLALCGSAWGETWQEALGRMPLGAGVTELNRTNCVPLLLGAFKKNDTVKALIFMPGATDEFYFFKRARARLEAAHPTLLDALTALTNQTYIETTYRAPFLLVHSVEDPIEPLIQVEDPDTAEKFRRKLFAKRILFNDRQWDYIIRSIAIRLNREVLPPRGSHESFHFFRHSLAGYDLTDWEALEALSLADKTRVTIRRSSVLFEGDNRTMGSPKLDHLPYGNPRAEK